jgi:hypothetical protein
MTTPDRGRPASVSQNSLRTVFATYGVSATLAVLVVVASVGIWLNGFAGIRARPAGVGDSDDQVRERAEGEHGY